MPIAGDFDSDGQRDDIAVFRPSNKIWYYDFNHDGNTDERSGPWGASGDLPISGDFDRDGKYDDVAVFRASERMWIYDFNHDGTTDERVSPWAVRGDMLFAGDFDGDREFDDVGVYRASNTTNYVDYDHNGSTDGKGDSPAMSSPAPESCRPVVIPSDPGRAEAIWSFCNGDWYGPLL